MENVHYSEQKHHNGLEPLYLRFAGERITIFANGALKTIAAVGVEPTKSSGSEPDAFTCFDHAAVVSPERLELSCTVDYVRQVLSLRCLAISP